MTFFRRLPSVRGFVYSMSALLAATAALGQQAPTPTTPAAAGPDRAAAYYHLGLAHIYEEKATALGRTDYATQAVEEYKLALNADPDNAMLQDGLAELYLKIGRVREAVNVAQEQVKKSPDDVAAHEILGKIYLRSLSDGQPTQTAEVLKLAITEYETITRLKPDSVEDHLLLGQMYGLNHDSVKAEEQLKLAQKLDANSEEVVLALARLYSEEGDLQRAVDVMSALPETDRTARIEFALATSYDQLKKPKDAAAAYRRALDIDGDNLDAQRGLASALLQNGDLDGALKQYQDIVTAEPQDAQSYIRISEIQRRQGQYDEALATLKKAKTLVTDSLELSYNEALLYDALGRFDEAVPVLLKLITDSSHADGNYTDSEKGNRAIFLDRLGIIYREQNKTQAAVDIYSQMVKMGGEYTARGYQGEIDAYRDAHEWGEATKVAADAAKAMPKDKNVQMTYAAQLADTGKVTEALTMAKAQLGGDDDRDLRLSLVQIYLRLKKWQDADVELDKVESMSSRPEDKLYVYFLRGTIAERQKLYEEAETQFRKALAIDPGNAATLNYLGFMMADHGTKVQESVDMVKKAVDFDPQNGAYLDSLGWAYFKNGQYALAEEYLLKAKDRLSTDPQVWDHLGQLYERIGKLKVAVGYWEKSLKQYSTSLAADIDQPDVAKVQRKLDGARVKLARNGTPAAKTSAAVKN